jgi:AraC-like DNA-binding protein
MPGSVTSVFSEPDELQAALRAEGVINLLVPSPGEFRARLTQARLHRLRLSCGYEFQSRIAFVVVPADRFLISLAIGEQPAPVWGGMEMGHGELIGFGPGQPVHTRTDGACRWGLILLSNDDLALYGRVLSGAGFIAPPVAKWRPGRAALRQLRHFQQAAVRRVEAWSAVLADRETAHGLEQQLIHALVECLAAGPVYQEPEERARHRRILAKLETLLEADPFPDLAGLGAGLGIPYRTLRSICRSHLGMGPGLYPRLRAMQLARRALQSGNPDTLSLPAVAGRYGWRDLGRFAAVYQTLYSEKPSATLQRRFP